MEVKFRNATLNDIEAIISLCNESFEEYTNVEYAKQKFIESENDKNQIYIIGEVDNQIVAHAKITIIPTIYEKMGTYSILNHICVKTDLRRQNIGTKLLNECEKISKEFNCNSMELWSLNFRRPAHECYKKYGFILKDAGFFTKELKGDSNEN